MATWFALLLTFLLVSTLTSQNGKAFAWGSVDLRPVAAALKSIEPRSSLMIKLLQMQESVKQLEKLPTCKKTASQYLINSCASDDDHTATGLYSTDKAPEDIKTVFAIKWVACTIGEAGRSMPIACQPVLDAAQNHIPAGDTIKKCQAALYEGDPSSNNMWVTFTSVASEASIMCHAMRSEFEKDQKLRAYEVLLSQLQDMGSAVQESTEEVEQMRAMFHGLRRDMANLHVQLQDENKQTQLHLQTAWADLENKMSGDMTNFGGDLEMFSRTMEAARKSFDAYAYAVDTQSSRTSEASTELANSHGANMDRLRRDVDNFFGFFEHTQQQAIQKFSELTDEVTNDLQAATALSKILVAGLNSINGGLANQATTIGVLNNQTASLLALQAYAHGQTMDNYAELNNMSERALQSVQAVTDSFGKFEDLLRIVDDLTHGRWVRLLGPTGPLILYFMMYFLISAAIMVIIFRRTWLGPIEAFLLAAVLGFVLSVFFTFVISPFEYLCGVAKTFPITTHLLPFSLVVLSVGVGLGLLLCPYTSRQTPRAHDGISIDGFPVRYMLPVASRGYCGTRDTETQ